MAQVSTYPLSKHRYFSKNREDVQPLIMFLFMKGYWMNYEYSSGLHQVTCGILPEHLAKYRIEFPQLPEVSYMEF